MSQSKINIRYNITSAIFCSTFHCLFIMIFEVRFRLICLRTVSFFTKILPRVWDSWKIRDKNKRRKKIKFAAHFHLYSKTTSHFIFPPLTHVGHIVFWMKIQSHWFFSINYWSNWWYIDGSHSFPMLIYKYR